MRHEVKISNTSDRRVVKIEEFNRFDPILYSSLSIPSYVHGYSLTIEYMRNWFLKGFPKNYFKYIHINGKHMFDDYKRWNKQNVKREKPLLIITPNVEFDYDRENLDLYIGGADIFLKKSDYQKSFFKDTDSQIYLGVQFQALKMNFNFKVRNSTRAEQLDNMKRMELVYRIGGTQAEDISVDYVIPEDIILNIAVLKGFEVKNKQIVNVTEFLSYLNAHSDLPFTYKLRTIKGKYEFFIRVNNIYTHISTMDKLNVDDGEREGQLDNNFNIDMVANVIVPVPHFFSLYNEKPLVYPIESGLQENYTGIGIYSISQFIMPEYNSIGWGTFINTNYLLDKEERVIDLSPLFGKTSTSKVIEDSLSKFISPNAFIDIKLFKEVAGDYPSIPYEMNWETKEITLLDDTLIDENIYIIIYEDKKYVNDTIISLNNIDQERITVEEK